MIIKKFKIKAWNADKLTTVVSGHLIMCIGKDFSTRRRLVGMSLAVNVGACELVRWSLQRTQFMYTSSESHVMWIDSSVRFITTLSSAWTTRGETRQEIWWPSIYTFNCHLLHWPCKIRIFACQWPVCLICTSGAEPGQLTNYWILPTARGYRTDLS